MLWLTNDQLLAVKKFILSIKGKISSRISAYAVLGTGNKRDYVCDANLYA